MAETDKLSLEEKNAQMRAQVIDHVQRWNEGMDGRIDKAQSNPDTAVFKEVWEEIKKVRKEKLPKFIDEYCDANRIERGTVNGEVDDAQRTTRVKNINKALDRYEIEVKNQIIANGISGIDDKDKVAYQVDKAYKAINNELPKPGLLSSIGGAFFDPDKGGIRWGAIAGAALGAWAALGIFGGLEAGLLGIAALVVGIFAGTWAGNFMSDALSAKKGPETEGQERSKQQGHGGPAPKLDGASPNKTPAPDRVAEPTSQIVNTDPAKTNIIYVDNEGKYVTSEPGKVPVGKKNVMQIKLEPVSNSKVKVTGVAVADEKGVFAPNEKGEIISFPPESERHFKIKGGVIDFESEAARINLNSLREEAVKAGINRNVEQDKKEEPKKESGKIEQGNDESRKDGEKVEQAERSDRMRNALNQYIGGYQPPERAPDNEPSAQFHNNPYTNPNYYNDRSR